MFALPALLIAIVEVDEASGIRCQAPECNHTVFRKIHVLRTAGAVKAVGSSCFKQFYLSEGQVKPAPLFTTKSGRILSSEERELLLEDVERLILRFESQHGLSRLDGHTGETSQRRQRKKSPSMSDSLALVRPEIVALAKKNVAARLGVDPNLPGWRGLVLEAVKAILRENAA
jgi:hypothetical protein